MQVSIVVPFYRGNAYMERLFQIVRENAAGFPDGQVELILVNDSPDVSVQYQPEWVQGFSLKILNNPENVGIHASRKNGILAAQGTYIQMLDQDDLLADDAIAQQVLAIDGNDIVVGNGTEQCGTHAGAIYQSLSQQEMVTELKYYYSIGCMITSPGQCLIRKEAIPKLWMDNPIHCNGADDLLLWLLMHNSGCRWTVNPGKVYTHVSTGVNLSADFYKMKESACEVVQFMKSNGMLTASQERQFDRRFQMRERYLNKGSLRKIAAMIRYPDLLIPLLEKKMRGMKKG